MTAIPLSQGAEPSFNLLVNPSSQSGVGDYDISQDNSCHCIAKDDFNNDNPTTFITGPQQWPAHLQLKVTTIISSIVCCDKMNTKQTYYTILLEVLDDNCAL